jgi:hypothetical protein
MGDAIWLFLAVPRWYFSSVLNPFGAGILSLIPSLGILCLLLGVIFGFIQRQKKLLFFLFPLSASELLAVIAGFYRGKVTDGGGIWMLLFIFAEILIAGFLIYRLKGARVLASLLAIFCVTYALFASFVARMSFSDSWL